MINEFFECSSNIPSGLSCLKTIETCGLLLLYNNSEDAQFVHEFTGIIKDS